MKSLFRNLIALAIVSVAVAANGYAQPKVIAHRGYWKCEGSTQNSIASLVNAAKAGVYGSEFDVNVTGDGVAVINHDGTIDGKVIDQTPYSEFAEVVLPNGEKMPTLAQYLAEGARHPQMKLILEIKSGSTPELEKRAVDIILADVKKAGVANQVEYIAFSRNVVEALLAADPKLTISYLNGDLTPEELKVMGCPWLDYNKKVLKANPEWIDQAKKNNIGINVWTVNKTEDMRYFVDRKVDYITTDEPVKLIELLKQ